MNSPNDTDYDEETNTAFHSMTSTTYHHQHGLSDPDRKCAVCGSKPTGLNFGVLTCAPCKAFFRRNARRRDLLELPCRHRDLSIMMRNRIEFNERTVRYYQIRRCSSCRLRRCFDMGMKEELVRTEEENKQYKQLIDMNRRRRDLLKQQLQQIKQLSIPQFIFNDDQLSDEVDWRHLSNIVYAYDACCIKVFIQQRETMIFNQPPLLRNEQSTAKPSTTLTSCIVLAFSSFLKSLPAYHSLPRSTRNYLCKTNIRPLIFPNIHELNQSCFSEPSQIAVYKATWEFMCGPNLYESFIQAEKLAETLWITDPIVTRLWIIILFFSSPLHYHDDCPTQTPILKKKAPLFRVQTAYITLLWKYLLQRHGDVGAVRIYSNLIHVYIKMQTVGFGIYTQLRTQKDLSSIHETIDKTATLNVNDAQ